METFVLTWRPWTILNIFAMFLLFMLIFYAVCKGGSWMKNNMSGNQ